MATKKAAAKPVPAHENTGEVPRNRQSDIEQRRKAKEEATTQEGVTPPENQDVNEPYDNPETAPS